MPEQEVKPRFVDFEKDVRQVALDSLVTLYTTPNPLNDIFTLSVVYGIGTLERPELSQLAFYLQLLGTDSMPFERFRNRLQAIGSTLTFDVNSDAFVMRVTGFDNHLDETLQLVGDFVRHVKADDTKLRQLVDEAKVTEKAFMKSNDNVVAAALEWVMYGEQSRYLQKLSLAQVRKLKGKRLLAAFESACQVQCDVHYCGTLPVETVQAAVRRYLPLEQVKVPSRSPFRRELRAYEKPTVFFVHLPDMSQSIVYGYVKGSPVDDERDRHAARLFSTYFGGDMSSLMFQEIREFRSYAYRTSGGYQLPSHAHRGAPGYFKAMLSTQGDKTLDALQMLDSLIREMPLKPVQMETMKQMMVNQVNNEYPTFRNLSERVAAWQAEGFRSDPSEAFLQDIAQMDMLDIHRFYTEQVAGRPVVYLIVGDRKRVNREALAKFGTVVELKRKEIYR